MRSIILYFILLIPAIGCDSDDSLENLDVATGTIDSLCNTTGTVKSGVYAQVSYMDNKDWLLIIEDTARIAQYLRQWKPFVCSSLPDTLKEEGLELVVSYSDKTVTHNDTLFMLGELLSAKAIRDFPEEDPRNDSGMGTILVENADGSTFYLDSALVFRDSHLWNNFLSSNPGILASREIDFDSETLLFQPISNGGCGWFHRRSLERVGTNELVYKVRAEIYGGCQVLLHSGHWVTVPKISETDTVIFVYEEIVHPGNEG